MVSRWTSINMNNSFLWLVSHHSFPLVEDQRRKNPQTNKNTQTPHTPTTNPTQNNKNQPPTTTNQKHTQNTKPPPDNLVGLEQAMKEEWNTMHIEVIQHLIKGIRSSHSGKGEHKLLSGS
ncbi:hypothetical protein J6590_074017 [Homalodisca vitripennis]|nr:hypothetical protein J6590_074017 [Homalodisca vitripennis]